MKKPEEKKNAGDSSVESTDLLAALTARMKHAEKRYLEEQQEGDAISIASTRGTFLALRDARDLVRHHFSANVEECQEGENH